jgi:quinol monooxygenase YgiN
MIQMQLLFFVLSTLILSPSLGVQSRGLTPADGALHIVYYVEVTPASRPATVAALSEYQAAIRKEDGFVGFELFEQTGRPGHYSFIETWRDQKAFDARSQATQKQLADKLQPIRISNMDNRFYKTLTIAPASGPPGAQTVYVVTHVDVSPNPQVPILLQRMAEESRKDEGNLRFDVLQHAMRANHFTVVEAWRDRKALDAHVAAAHTKQYREELGPMLGSPLDERLVERVTP